MSVLIVQQKLKAAGFDPGPLDGVWGLRTQQALDHALTLAAHAQETAPAPSTPAGFALNTRSLERLAGVHTDLAKVVKRAAQLSTVPFIITEGLRSLERQRELYAQGRTTPGPVVTGTMQSRHLTGHAVDLAPVKPDGTVDWKDLKAFDAIYTAMMNAAGDMRVPLRSGMDWDRDGKLREKGESDSPHYELPARNYP